MQPLPDTAAVVDLIREATAKAFIAANAAKAHDPLALSISGLGGCTRKAAYALAVVKPSDTAPEEEARAAMLGTWEHEGMLPWLAKVLGGEYERPVMLRAHGLEIPGTLDLYAAPILIDQKTVGEHRLHRVRRQGDPFRNHRQQVRAYGLAAVQDGLEVRYLAWLYLDRASGDEEPMVEEFTNAAALDVLDRVKELMYWAEHPDQAPREERGPGLSYSCDGCPWLRRCWGPTAVPRQVGAQTSLAESPPGLEAAIAFYDAASARKSDATRDQEFAAAVLAATAPSVYGPWLLRRDRGGSVMDQAAVTELFAELGREVPKKPTAGGLRVRLVEALSPAVRKRLIAEGVLPPPD
jgi:hypothetical protein